MPSSPLDKKIIAEHFNKAAASYDKAAFIQREIGLRLDERLDEVKISPLAVLDLGCGTGQELSKLKQRYAAATLYAVDQSSEMLQHAELLESTTGEKTIKYITAFAETLPFEDNSIDLIFCNLMFQWCDPLLPALQECFRVLNTGGLLLFSTLGPDTLQELRYCWSKIDSYPHINHFLDMHPIGDQLLQVGFSDPVMDMEYITASYKDVISMMQDLKNIGATNADKERRKTLTGKTRLQQLSNHYQQFAMEDKRLPMTYEVIYGHAWKLEKQTKKELPTEVYVKLEDVKWSK